MAYNVTSEWDDIHRKIGNYEPLPEVKKQEEYVKENIEELEQLAEKDKKPMSEDSDLDEDDDFFEEYKRKRLEEMGKKQEDEDKPKEKLFGYVAEITAQNYVKEVNEAGEDVEVVLNFYQSYVNLTQLVNKHMETVAKEFPKVKFLKTVSTKCVENFPDSKLPYMLFYKNGDLIKTIGLNDFKNYTRISAYSLKHLLNKSGVTGIKIDKQSKTKAKDYRDEMMGKSSDEEKDYSDDEEREDKQYISNKIFIKY